MAYKRLNVGSVCYRKEDADLPAVDPKTGEKIFKRKHLKISGDMSFKKGDYLNLETKAEQLKNLNEAAASGKISEANAEKARKRIEKIPDFVLFEVYQLSKT